MFHRPGYAEPLCLEPFLSGDYVKHSDNAGHRETDNETAAAFSYFTYILSQKMLVVCDIQGVGTFYTDPQIHTTDGEGFGAGNLGAEGIRRFLRTHRHNLLCEELGWKSGIWGTAENAQLVSQCDTLWIESGIHTAWNLFRKFALFLFVQIVVVFYNLGWMKNECLCSNKKIFAITRRYFFRAWTDEPHHDVHPCPSMSPLRIQFGLPDSCQAFQALMQACRMKNWRRSSRWDGGDNLNGLVR